VLILAHCTTRETGAKEPPAIASAIEKKLKCI
jgi:hypothetical protein